MTLVIMCVWVEFMDRKYKIHYVHDSSANNIHDLF